MASKLVELPPEIWANIMENHLTKADKFLSLGMANQSFHTLVREGTSSLSLYKVGREDQLTEALIKIGKMFPNVRRLDDILFVIFRQHHFQHLPRTLRELDLGRRHFTVLTEESVKMLPPGLKKLNLGYLSIGATLVPHLPRQLTELCLRKNPQLDNSVFGALPKTLEKLDLGFIQNVNNETLALLPKQLKELDLSGCEAISDSGIKDIPRGVLSLKLGWCSRVTDAGIKDLPSALQSLDLSYCENVTDEGTKTLPATLKKLVLFHCTKVTNETLPCLPKDLEYLDLSFCSVTNKGLCALNLESIKRVLVKSSDILTNEMRLGPDVTPKRMLDSIDN